MRNTIRDAGGGLYLELKRQNSELAATIGRLREVGKTLESALTTRGRNARAWIKSVIALRIEVPDTAAVERGVAAMETGGIAKFHTTFNTLREAAQKVAAEVSRRGRPTLDRMTEIQRQRNELKADIDALALGLPPRNSVLLNALNNSLLARGADLPARHLRELRAPAREAR